MLTAKNYKVTKAKGKSSLAIEDDEVYIVSKQYDVDTGEELSDNKEPCPSTEGLDFEIKKINEYIDKLTVEKESLELLKADYIELKGD